MCLNQLFYYKEVFGGEKISPSPHASYLNIAEIFRGMYFANALKCWLDDINMKYAQLEQGHTSHLPAELDCVHKMCRELQTH